MPKLRKPKWAKGMRVNHEDHDCLVLAVNRSTLTIRNKFGFKEDVPKKDAVAATPR